MKSASAAKPIPVAGSSGKTGSRIVARLAGQGILVWYGSRLAAPPFDWQRPASWASALRGVRAVYLAYAPGLAVPGAVEAVRTVASGVWTAPVMVAR